MDKIVYYLSQPDDKPLIHLHVLSYLRKSMRVQYHDDNGYMDVEKTFHAIKRKHFRPSLLKEIRKFVGKCIYTVPD